MSIDQTKRDEIIEALELGMPLRSVADLVEIDFDVIRAEREADRAFDKAINKAIAQCMHDRLEHLKNCKNWQALAFILTSLWPARFGRNSKGTPRMARLLETPHVLDFTRLDPYELQWFDYLMAKLDGDNPTRPTDPGSERTEVQSGATPDRLCLPGVACD